MLLPILHEPYIQITMPVIPQRDEEAALLPLGQEGQSLSWRCLWEEFL